MSPSPNPRCPSVKPSAASPNHATATRNKPAEQVSSPKSGCASNHCPATPASSSPTRLSATMWTAFSSPPSRSVQAACAEGVFAGCPIVDVKIDFFDGKQHPVDSKDIAFQIAGKAAFQEAFLNAKPSLLEPILNLRVTAPEDAVGDVMADISARRGRVLGVESEGHFEVITAQVPQAGLYRYSSHSAPSPPAAAPTANRSPITRKCPRKCNGIVWIKRDVDGVRRCQQQERIAVGGRSCHGLQCQISACAGSVFDDDRLSQTSRKRIADKPADEIGNRPCREEDDQIDWPRGITLSLRHAWQGWKSGGAQAQFDEFSPVQSHDVSSGYAPQVDERPWLHQFSTIREWSCISRPTRSELLTTFLRSSLVRLFPETCPHVHRRQIIRSG